jgi:hypothetical protein
MPQRRDQAANVGGADFSEFGSVSRLAPAQAVEKHENWIETTRYVNIERRAAW